VSPGISLWRKCYFGGFRFNRLSGGVFEDLDHLGVKQLGNV
jgi:hypothetical protein